MILLISLFKIILNIYFQLLSITLSYCSSNLVPFTTDRGAANILLRDRGTIILSINILNISYIFLM